MNQFQMIIFKAWACGCGDINTDTGIDILHILHILNETFLDAFNINNTVINIFFEILIDIISFEALNLNIKIFWW